MQSAYGTGPQHSAEAPLSVASTDSCDSIRPDSRTVPPTRLIRFSCWRKSALEDCALIRGRKPLPEEGSAIFRGADDASSDGSGAELVSDSGRGCDSANSCVEAVDSFFDFWAEPRSGGLEVAVLFTDSLIGDIGAGVTARSSS